MSLRKNVRNRKSTVLVGMQRRIEIWRKGELVDVDEKLLNLEDLVVDSGLNALCGQAFDGSGSRPAVSNYCAIGTDGTASAASQTALGAEVMRVQATYTKDANVGECSVDATFNITGTYALQECGLFNAAAVGTMYCRDTYTTKNVVSGDTVKAFEEYPRMRPKFIIRLNSKELLRERRYMPNLVTVICPNCGREFQARACRPKKYCSYECYVNYCKIHKYPLTKPRIKVICKNCGREFEAKACRLNTKYGVTFCSRECYVAYYRIHGWHFAKPKIKLTCKKCGKIFEVKPSEAGLSPKGYCRKYCSLQCALTSIDRRPRQRTEEEKQQIRERFKIHQKAVTEQAEVLKQQGFKVIIVDKVRPDIIARKDNKIYAVEVELDKPDYGKYEGIELFDDIMWIFKEYTPKFQRPA